jgi:hypothetical protein
MNALGGVAEPSAIFAAEIQSASNVSINSR